MRLSDYLAMARAHWLALSSFLAVGLLLAALAALYATPTFDATSEMVLVTDSGGTAQDLAQGADYSQRQVRTFSTIATRPIVLQPTIDDLRLGESVQALARQVSVTSILNTDVITISASATSAQQAADIANAVAKHLSEAVTGLVPSLENGDKSVRLESIRSADAPSSPSSPNIPLWLILGLLGGLAVGACFVALREALDTKVRTTEEAQLRIDVPFLGSVAYDRRSRGILAVAHGTHTLRSEAYRHLRTSLSFLAAGGDGRKLFVVTSSVPGEGKTTTALNLAASVAATGQRVCLVEADLRRPVLAKALGIEGAVGLSAVLAEHVDIADVTQVYGPDGLHVVPGGTIPPNPSELLSSPRMRGILDELREAFDCVIVDCPPLLPVTDAVIVGRVADGVLFVVGLGIVRKAELARSFTTLRAGGTEPLGMVANGERISERDRYGYEYEPSAASTPAPEPVAGEPQGADPAWRADDGSNVVKGAPVTEDMPKEELSSPPHLIPSQPH